MNIRPIISLLLLPALVCCSIKEDRSKCPGVLVLDFSQVENFDSVGVRIRGEGLDFARMYHRDEYSSVEPMKIALSEVECMSFYGNDWFGSAEILPIEQDCPQIWFHSQRVCLDGSCNTCVIMFHKQYCHLDIAIKYSGQSEVEDIQVKVGSPSAGYFRDGSIADGKFCCLASPSSDGKCSLNLPRQKNAELLTLTIEDGEAGKTFPLGKYLMDAGYDWQKASLEDISIVIDLAMLSLSLSTQSIEETYYHTYAII